ncbi:MAG: GP88 family protein [Candidatus Woesearchaeota archaeon]
MKNILIKGNIKMGKNVYLFNIPAKNTCTPTDWCLHGMNGKPACYGLRNNFLLPNAINSAKERYELSKTKEFVSLMTTEIQSKNPKYFRFHAIGDFYNQEYVRKVIEIAKECPNTLFRTTTRRRDLTKIIQELNSLPNFIVRESLDIERKNPVMNLPYAAIASVVDNKNLAYKCPDDCVLCNYHCWNNRIDIYFDEH